MKLFEGQLLVSDFDGTLISSDGTISTKNVQAINYFTQNGGLFCGATGRTQFTIAPYLNELPINCPWILYNGACLYDLRSGTLKHVTYLDRVPIADILKKVILEFPGICVHIYTYDHIYLVNKNGREDRSILSEKQSYKYKEIDSIKDPWIKIIFHDENGILQKVFSTINRENIQKKYNAFFSCGTYLEITNAVVSKGSALEKLKMEMGSRVTKVIAIGDYLNDMELLQKADFKAAPMNSHQELKNLADYITDSHDHHAVADLIEYIRMLSYHHCI